MKPIYHDLRTYRKDCSALSQEDIAELLGTKNASQIVRHETNPISPQLEIALLYEILFKKPVSDFFQSHRQNLINRLRLRIPNVIDEMKCLEQSTIVSNKIQCLQDILTNLN